MTSGHLKKQLIIMISTLIIKRFRYLIRLVRNNVIRELITI